MTASRFCPPYTDEAIVAWLDGEMRADEQLAFEKALKRDQTLSSRTAELMKSNQPFAEAFAPLLEDAPLARMTSRLEDVLSTTPENAPQKAVQVSRRALIAASVSVFVVGSSVGFLARSLAPSHRDESEKIRELEAQYMSLYSPETLADVDSSQEVLQRALARVMRDLELPLNIKQLTLLDASLKSVRMLRYDDALISQIAWNHHSYGPMALCISRDAAAQSVALQQEKRHGMNLAWWHQAGYQYVLIGRNPAQQLKTLALQLSHRLAV
ncbi:hypothetical protein CIG19_15340 [Enterobacterales bacterium CwR94]|nr:hypothetical protein CIG19_15340 [Enterobacterales bacterium CwR94]